MDLSPTAIALHRLQMFAIQWLLESANECLTYIDQHIPTFQAMQCYGLGCRALTLAENFGCFLTSQVIGILLALWFSSYSVEITSCGDVNWGVAERSSLARFQQQICNEVGFSDYICIYKFIKEALCHRN